MRNNKWKIVLFLFIFSIGIFLRSYHFSQWLHFELDQSYDIHMVSPAVEHGVFNLPLLGPTAAGSRTLRLGPAYYYLEYLSAVIFGNTPPGHAAFVLIFGILAMPLFYFFTRRYFSLFISFSLLAIFSISLYMVIYSRFSWNPNILPFFTLLSFYALLRSVSKEEKRKERWFLISMAAIAIATQAHFNAFFIIPSVAALFLLIKHPRFKRNTWIFALLIFIVAYSPVVLSDIKTGGVNLHFFIEQLQGGQGKGQNTVLGLRVKTIQTMQYTASEYFLIITGIDHINTNRKMIGFGFDKTIDLPWRAAALFLLFLAVVILLVNLKKEKNSKHKDFLLLALLLLLVSASYFFAMQGRYTIYPRFYLEVSILPYVFLGLILEKISFKKLGRAKFILPGLLIFLIILANAQGLRKYFSELQNVDREPLPVSIEDVFPNTARVTLDQQSAIVNYIESKVRQNGYPVYLSSSNEYERNFWYLLEKDGIFFEQQIENKAIYAQGNYFMIPHSGNGIDGYTERFNITEEKKFGALDVFYLIPKPEAIASAKQEPDKMEIPAQILQIDKIPTWKKLLEQ